MKKKLISIIIPYRVSDDYSLTLKTLEKQSYGFENFEIIPVCDKYGLGANWARNQGRKLAHGEYLLFSDNDINWKKSAIENLYHRLNLGIATGQYTGTLEPSYCYGKYIITNSPDQRALCGYKWEAWRLQKHSFISTMTLIRTEHFPEEGFDESIRRLQDWDLWLTMWLKYHRFGVLCDKVIFTTTMTPQQQTKLSDAQAIIKVKHKL